MFNIRFSPKAKESLASISDELDTRERAIDLRRDSALAHLVGMNMARRGQRPPRPGAETLVEVPSSGRYVRRQRRRNSEDFARKSRRAGFLRRQAQRDAEENFRGQARVYFGLSRTASPAMTANVVGAVQDLAEKLSTRDGMPYTKALERVEERMRALLVDFGDLDADVALYGEGAA